MKLNPEPFLLIKNGQKTVEMRLYDNKRALIDFGDTITFTNNKTGQTLNCLVVGLKKFKNFSLLYGAYDKISLGYLPQEKASPDDMLIYYSKEEQEKYGVVAIEIKVV